MLGFLAAALLTATQSPAPATPAPATPEAAPETATVPKIAPDASPPLESAAPWWERITITVDDKGTQQSCRYETNLKRAEACDQAISASIKSGGKNRQGLFSKVTFERRFTPGGKPDAGKMKPGDTLLGRQVMYLSIDAAGAIDACQVVSSSGEVPPDYGCDEAKKEKFAAQAGAEAAARPAFMTVTAYGHMELIA